MEKIKNKYTGKIKAVRKSNNIHSFYFFIFKIFFIVNCIKNFMKIIVLKHKFFCQFY